MTTVILGANKLTSSHWRSPVTPPCSLQAPAPPFPAWVPPGHWPSAPFTTLASHGLGSSPHSCFSCLSDGCSSSSHFLKAGVPHSFSLLPSSSLYTLPLGQPVNPLAPLWRGLSHLHVQLRPLPAPGDSYWLFLPEGCSCSETFSGSQGP